MQRTHRSAGHAARGINLIAVALFVVVATGFTAGVTRGASGDLDGGTVRYAPMPFHDERGSPGFHAGLGNGPYLRSWRIAPSYDAWGPPFFYGPLDDVVLFSPFDDGYQPWWTNAPSIYANHLPYFYSADLGVYLGGAALGFALENSAPSGYAYFDPYCNRGFSSVSQYLKHVKKYHHPAALTLRWVGNPNAAGQVTESGRTPPPDNSVKEETRTHGTS